VISLNEAIDSVLAAVRPLESENVALLDALGRTAVRDVVSAFDVPSFDNSAMDGFAVRGADLVGAGAVHDDGLVIAAEIPAGRVAERPLEPGEAARIMTGAPLPAGADTVVQVEHTRERDGRVVIDMAPPPGSNVRHAGEDLTRGGVALPAGALIGPAELGLLASIAVETVEVARRPRVAILATGSELVPLGERLAPGQLHNSNSFTAYGQALAAGAEPVMLGIARDDPDETKRLLARALEEDVTVSSGGVSVGDYDFVKQVQDELGVERRFWGVATKPGKPLSFGVRGDHLVFGVPGNPVAAMVTFELYVRPALLAMQGRTAIWRPWVLARAAEPVKRTKGRVEVRRCRLSRDPDGAWRFATTGPQGSAILSSMAMADGFAIVPAEYPGGPAGESFLVLLPEGARAERPPFPG
jgi:molybdopterin molybdotransferase